MNLATASSLLIVVAAIALGLGSARAAPRAADLTPIGGREYARVAEWTATHGLEARWLKRDETLQVSDHSSRLVLEVDSREALFNGVKIWLSFPVAERNGSVYVAQLDLQTTLQPLLWPPKIRHGAAVKLICLDPGHGGSDPGFVIGSRQEKKYALLLARELCEQLSRSGFKVILTRSRDTRVELPARTELAKHRNADLFISLHFNSAGASTEPVQGAEVYCLTPPGASSTNARGEGAGAGASAGTQWNDKNMFLAYLLQKSLAACHVEDRGVKRARFEVLRDASMPAALIEAGFLSHAVEGRKITDAAYRRRLAQAMRDGVVAYKRAVEQ